MKSFSLAIVIVALLSAWKFTIKEPKANGWDYVVVFASLVFALALLHRVTKSPKE